MERDKFEWQVWNDWEHHLMVCFHDGGKAHIAAVYRMRDGRYLGVSFGIRFTPDGRKFEPNYSEFGTLDEAKQFCEKDYFPHPRHKELKVTA